MLAAADGKVVVIDLAYGAVCIKHSNGYFTKYFHLLPNTIRVKVNDSVVKGETIGISGTTGAPNNAPHLHFEVLNGSYKPIDPYKENLWESKVVNKRPNPPQIPSGPSTGWVNVACNFTASTTDPEEESVAYQFYWNEGDISNWSNFVPSGTSVTMSKLGHLLEHILLR